MTLTLILALALGAPASEPGATEDPPPLHLGSEAGAAPGFLLSGYTLRQGALLDSFASLAVRGRYRAAPGGGFADHLFVEGEAAPLLALGPSALAGLNLVARGGLAFPTWAVAVGLHAHLLETAAPLQLLPSVTAVWHPGWWGLSLGVLEHALGPVARLGVDLGPLSVSYAAPFGGEVSYAPQLVGPLALELRLFGFGLLGAFQIGGSVGLLWRPSLEPPVPERESLKRDASHEDRPLQPPGQAARGRPREPPSGAPSEGWTSPSR